MKIGCEFKVLRKCVTTEVKHFTPVCRANACLEINLLFPRRIAKRLSSVPTVTRWR